MEAELSREQLESFPPELRTVAQRYGVEMLNFCIVVAGTNRAIDQMLGFGERFDALGPPSMVVLDNMSTLCNVILMMKGWQMDQVVECIGDIGRAQALVAHIPKRIVH